MLFFTNIKSVATYESKLLIRSWFFKIFTVLAILFITAMNISRIVGDSVAWNWSTLAIPANLPYMNLMLLNVGQAIIAIFLASDFLKRDKKLDTSEVFYVHSLSNAEYVFGKIWGNMRVFIFLNVVILGITLIFNFIAEYIAIDILSYLYYFLLISVPTLIYIFGLSVLLMLLLKNQALTFIILLGYIGVSAFYIKEQFYWTFDYMGMNLPLVKSTIIGFSNLHTLLLQRSIYLLFGFACISLTIVLFKRLPNSWKSNRPWIVVSTSLFIAAFGCAWIYVSEFKQQDTIRKVYTELNNQYVDSPKIVVDRYNISVEQQEKTFSAHVEMDGKAVTTADRFTFTLNPGLTVSEITSDDRKLNFKTDHHILIVEMGKEIEKDSTVRLTIDYAGSIDQNICYLDIPEEVRTAQASLSMFFTYDKQYAVQRPNFLLLTPETYWYPRPGTNYSNENPSWQQTYFSEFETEIKPIAGLTPVTQGAVTLSDDSTIYRFKPEYPLQSISLIIADYEKKSLFDPQDSVEYSIYNVVGNDYFSMAFDSLRADTIPTFIHEVQNYLYRNLKLEYPFKRFSIVEVPIQFATFERSWTQTHETMQPEMVLYPERAAKFDGWNFMKRKEMEKEWAKQYDNRTLSETDAQIQLLNNVLWSFTRSEGEVNFSQSGRGKYNVTSSGSNPYYIFPQIYNFKYNIYSNEWAIANRMIEVYLQQSGNGARYDWRRNVNGISDTEKATLLMQEKPFKELISDPELRYLVNSFLALKAGLLFAPVEQKIGVEQFRDSVYRVLDQNAFRNISFENLLDTLGSIGETDLKQQIPDWNKTMTPPVFEISTPDVVRVNYHGSESYELSIMFSNVSDYPGVLKMSAGRPSLNSEDGKNVNQVVELAPHQTKRVVVYFEEFPNQIGVNTLFSGNLPNALEIGIPDVSGERRDYRYPEGETVVPNRNMNDPDIIIVDNEDEELFELSEAKPVGYLPRWLDQTVKSDFKYSGISAWNPPLEWTATTGNNYYGKAIRSAYVIKTGDGSQTATWKIPLKEKGEYDLFYYLTKPEEMRWRRHGRNREKVEYHFRIQYNDEEEDAYLDLNRSEDGWVQLGSYFLDSDTVKIVLDNEVAGRTVIADAVKLENRIIGRKKPTAPRRGQGQGRGH